MALSLCNASPARAEQNWLTLAGDASSAGSEYIQFDPSQMSREAGVVTIPVRVSRAQTRTSQDGVVFRSYSATAAIDCVKRTARFLRVTFFAEPDFGGEPVETREFGTVVRAMAFRGIAGERVKQVIRAACKEEVEKAR